MFYNVNATDSVNQLIKNAQVVASKYNNNLISTEHLLYGVLCAKDNFSSKLNEYGITKENFEEVLQNIEQKDVNNSTNIDLTALSKQIFVIAKQISNQLEQKVVDNGHILFAILLNEDSVAVQILVNEYNIELGNSRNWFWWN